MLYASQVRILPSGPFFGGCYDIAKRKLVNKKRFIDNWNLYLNFPKIFQCNDHELPTYDINGETAKYSFLCLENGIKLPTKEWELLKRIQEGKKSVNLQMKLWAEDVGDILFPNELKEYCNDYPDWVFKGTMNQAEKKIFEKIGFIPTFMKIYR